MVDKALCCHISGTSFGVDVGGGAQIGAAGHDAKHARQTRHTHTVSPMGLLPGLRDFAEHLRLGHCEDRQPVEPCPSRLAVARGCPERDGLRPARAFVHAQTHAIDDQTIKTGMGFQKPADFSLDGAAFQIRRALPLGGARPQAALVNHLREGFNSNRLDRHERCHRGDNMIPGARPVGAGQLRMDHQKLPGVQRGVRKRRNMA